MPQSVLWTALSAAETLRGETEKGAGPRSCMKREKAKRRLGPVPTDVPSLCDTLGGGVSLEMGPCFRSRQLVKKKKSCKSEIHEMDG